MLDYHQFLLFQECLIYNTRKVKNRKKLPLKGLHNTTNVIQISLKDKKENKIRCLDKKVFSMAFSYIAHSWLWVCFQKCSELYTCKLNSRRFSDKFENTSLTSMVTFLLEQIDTCSLKVNIMKVDTLLSLYRMLGYNVGKQFGEFCGMCLIKFSCLFWD